MIGRTFLPGIAMLIAISACNGSQPDASPLTKANDTTAASVPAPNEYDTTFTSFLPEGYVIFDRVYGDLNKDGLNDCALIIKATDTSRYVMDEYRGRLDRNRRGIVVLLNKGKTHEVIVKNYSCFSSENEDGGVYFPPDLTPEIVNGKLYLQYSHGRYGYWKYTFRYQHSDLELIGYDASNCMGPVIKSETSINFLTKKKQEKVNVNENAEGGDEVFEEEWTNISVPRLLKLSEIEDFDAIEMSQW
jgi:hypothetical protein